MVTKSYLRFVSAMGAVAVALAMVPSAFAGCGLPSKLAKPAAWHQQLGSAHLLTVSTETTATPSIVGMWHVIFTAKTSNGTAIPDTVVDNALVVWHNDNTEIMNSVRPPQDGDFCLGVWEQTGPLNYRLNHFAWFANAFPNSTNNGIGEPIGPTRFVEWATLAADGNHYTGTFGLYSHDTSGKPGQSFTGTLTATRITMATSTADLF
jgi:hypothetical protein